MDFEPPSRLNRAEAIALRHKILRFLDDKGMTQKDLANKAGIKASYISKVINGGVKQPPYRMVAKLIREIGLENDELFRKPGVARPDEILEAIRSRTGNQERPRSALIIGAVNRELVYQLGSDPFDWGGKIAATLTSGFGGSAANIAGRLLKLGVLAVPIAPIPGGDDQGSILNEFVKFGNSGNVNLPTKDLLMKADNEKATLDLPTSTILSTPRDRTILMGQSERLNHAYRNHLTEFCEFWRSRKDKNESSPFASLRKLKPCLAVIGHITPDGNQESRGELTRKLIDLFSDEKIPILANFGSSQLNLPGEERPADRWIPSLSKISFFQLSLEEARRFVRKDREDRVDQETPSLKEILDWFAKNTDTNVAITLGRIGAVLQLRRRAGRRGKLIIAWAFSLPKGQLDMTGAGDAHLAGVAYYAAHQSLDRLDGEAMLEAMAVGSLFGSQACTTMGGAVPASFNELTSFGRENHRIRRNHLLDIDEAGPHLNLFDQIFAEGFG